MAPKKQQYLSSPAPKQDDPQDNGGTVFGETSEYNGTEDVEDVKSVGKQPKMLVRHLSAKNETNETREQEDDDKSRRESALTPSYTDSGGSGGSVASPPDLKGALPRDGAERIGGKMVSVEQVERMRSSLENNGTRATYIGSRSAVGDNLGLL